MHLYEYECKKCGCRFEKRQSFNDKAEAACPTCQSGCFRVILPAPVIFKGSGFYVTDHRKSDSGDNGHKTFAPKAEKTETAAKVDKPAKAETKS